MPALSQAEGPARRRRGPEVTSENVAFDERVAAHYEAWYETVEGRRADELEKAVLGWLLQGGTPGRRVGEGRSGLAAAGLSRIG
jgi:hypothetical protein